METTSISTSCRGKDCVHSTFPKLTCGITRGDHFDIFCFLEFSIIEFTFSSIERHKYIYFTNTCYAEGLGIPYHCMVYTLIPFSHQSLMPRQTCPRPNCFSCNLRSKTRLFKGFCNLMVYTTSFWTVTYLSLYTCQSLLNSFVI